MLTALGSAATVFMSGRVRAREAALVQAAGGTPRVVVAAAAGEAVVLVGTAALLGALAVVVGAAAGAFALGGTWTSFGVAAMALSAGAALVVNPLERNVSQELSMTNPEWRPPAVIDDNPIPATAPTDHTYRACPRHRGPTEEDVEGTISGRSPVASSRTRNRSAG